VAKLFDDTLADNVVGQTAKGLGANFEEKLIELVKQVSVQDIQRVANECIKDPFVLTILAPEEYLKEV